MTELVVGSSIAMAIVLFAAGLIDLIQAWSTRKTTKEAVEAAATLAKSANADTDSLKAQSAPDFTGAWNALAALATALKDLDRSSRLFLLSLAFVAVAGAGAGIDGIADAIAK